MGPGTAGIREARAKGALLRISTSCTKCLHAQAVSHTQLGSYTHTVVHVSIWTPFLSSHSPCSPQARQMCSSHISKSLAPAPFAPAVIYGWLSRCLLDLFVCLPHTLFVCCLPAELFSACILSLGWPALPLDGISLPSKPAEAAWLSWHIPSMTRTIPGC